MDDAFEASVVIMAFVGVLGCSLLPLRASQLVVRGELALRLKGDPFGQILGIIVAGLFLWCCYVGALSLPRVFTCLMGEVCGANRSQGLILLAIFGMSCLVLESALVLARFVALRAQARSVKPT